MTWKTILLPHDFSSCANHATALARDIALVHQARIVLLHVAELPRGFDGNALVIQTPDSPPVPARQLVMMGAGVHLEDLAKRLRKEGVEVEVQLAAGNIVDEILDFSRRENADLIVMGTHGRTGLAHVVMGSVTERVVRQSHVPVMTLREDEKRDEK